MPNCCVFGCLTTSQTPNAKLFTFPTIDKRSPKCIEFSKQRLSNWMAVLKKSTVNECKNLKICHLHFISGMKARLLDINNPDWVPSLNLNDDGMDLVFQGAPDFTNEMEKEISELYATAIDYDDDIIESGDGERTQIESSELHETHRSIASQTDIQVTGLSTNLILSYEEKIRCLEEKLSRSVANLESFEGKDAKTCFFTGLTTFIVMKELFLTLEPNLPETSQSLEHGLTKFQVFFMVLYRMRLNLSFRYLAYKFEVSPQTISKYFYEGLFVMFSKMRSLVYFPTRVDIRKTMPLSFQERFADQITIIIDCFEVYIERSSIPKALAQTWSFYKHHNTLKFLIGITPQGMICFISEGYGGRSSDKFVTENCGFLESLENGDVVMVDRGFLIEDSLKRLGARAEILAFTKGQNQLHPYELEKTRKIANLRIQVEQIIGLLRMKYTIFSQCKFPISTISKVVNRCNVSVVDQMITVCSALINLCTPICVKENDN